MDKVDLRLRKMQVISMRSQRQRRSEKKSRLQNPLCSNTAMLVSNDNPLKNHIAKVPKSIQKLMFKCAVFWADRSRQSLLVVSVQLLAALTRPIGNRHQRTGTLRGPARKPPGRASRRIAITQTPLTLSHVPNGLLD